MATARLPDELFDLVAHHLPPERPVGGRGGRPRVGPRTALRVIWFVLAPGDRWADVPPELGCSGRTAHRRLRTWEEAGRLDTDLAVIDSVYVRAFGGGEQTGPSPVDRRKRGTKHALMVSRSGVPLKVRTAGANASDHTQIIPLVLDFPAVGGRPGHAGSWPTSTAAG